MLLDAKRAQGPYEGAPCAGMRVLVVGAGPAGLWSAIEVRLGWLPTHVFGVLPLVAAKHTDEVCARGLIPFSCLSPCLSPFCAVRDAWGRGGTGFCVCFFFSLFIFFHVLVGWMGGPRVQGHILWFLFVD